MNNDDSNSIVITTNTTKNNNDDDNDAKNNGNDINKAPGARAAWGGREACRGWTGARIYVCIYIYIHT